MDVEFDVVASYVAGDDNIVTDRIVNVSISELPRTLKEGDLYMEVALPFIALDVEENID